MVVRWLSGILGILCKSTVVTLVVRFSQTVPVCALVSLDLCPARLSLSSIVFAPATSFKSGILSSFTHLLMLAYLNIACVSFVGLMPYLSDANMLCAHSTTKQFTAHSTTIQYNYKLHNLRLTLQLYNLCRGAVPIQDWDSSKYLWAQTT
jgi:hypothetical protein